jgi:hypothetical protein
MTEIIRPYADLEGIFAGVEYRANPVEAFQPIDIDGDAATTIVQVDDLRTIPQHQLRLRLDLEVLKPHYHKHKDKIRLVVIARDTMLRREIRLGDFALDDVPAIIDLERSLLRMTALRDVLPLNLSVVLDERLKGEAAALPIQRASRLTELRLIIKNTAGGATFPFKRVSAEKFRDEGKPAETGIHLELLCDPEELLHASDTPIANLFEVWVHEKVWAAIQNDRAPVASKMRLAAATLTTAHLLLSAVVPLLKDGQEIEKGSVAGQLLSHVEKQASLPEGKLTTQFQTDASLHGLDPYLQNAWRFVTTMGKIDEDAEEQQ